MILMDEKAPWQLPGTTIKDLPINLYKITRAFEANSKQRKMDKRMRPMNRGRLNRRHKITRLKRLIDKGCYKISSHHLAIALMISRT